MRITDTSDSLLSSFENGLFNAEKWETGKKYKTSIEATARFGKGYKVQLCPSVEGSFYVYG